MPGSLDRPRQSSNAAIVWLVDATTYRPRLPADLAAMKAAFFRMESVARERQAAPSLRGVRTMSGGLLRIATILRGWGYEPVYMTLDEVAVALDNLGPADMPSVVGFGAVCPTVPACAAITERIRECLPFTRCVLGGAHAMVAARLTASMFPVFDDIVGVPDVLAAARLVGLSNGPAAPPAGIDYRGLPHPVNEYAFNLQTVSGCPFSCSYCHDQTMPRSLEKLDGGLGQLTPVLAPGTHVHYADSVLGGSLPRALRVCDAIERCEHQLMLSCDLRPEFVRRELLSSLVRAGFREIRIGLDSADETVLAGTKRTARARALPAVLERVKSFSEDIYVSVYVVTGLPGSTRATLPKNLELIDYLVSADLANQIKHHLYVPYPRDDSPGGPPGVRVITQDWTRYDRNSPPCYELPDLDPDALWEAFIATERCINSVWQRQLGLSEEQIAAAPMHSDYNAQLYTTPSNVDSSIRA